jgi:hypothetical protein
MTLALGAGQFRNLLAYPRIAISWYPASNRRCGMSILDRVSKAVGDAVDRGKKEVDHFVRIQKINSQIGDLQKSIGESNGQIQQTKLLIGEIAIEMLRAGTLVSEEINSLLEKIAGIQQQISSLEVEIVQKKTEIESIRSEGKAAKEPGSAAEETAAPPPDEIASRFCAQCGAPASSGAFCSRCGSKLT